MHRKAERHRSGALPDGADPKNVMPRTDLEEDALDEALRETFPASDPVAIRID